MPLGRFLRFVDRVTGDNAIGNVAGSLGRTIQRRSNRRSAATESAMGAIGAGAGPEVSLPTPPGPPQIAGDTFDTTGAVAGGVLGGAVGAIAGPGGAAIGGAAGSQLGQAIGRQIPVPGGAQQTAIQAGSNPFALLETVGRGRGGRRVALEILLSSGALNGVIRQPVIYTASDGRTRYGSDPGYVLITRMSGGRQVRFQMPRFIAQELGFWKRRRKPVVSVRDSNAIRRSNAARKRLSRVAKGAGLYVRNSPPRRQTSTTRRRTRR